MEWWHFIILFIGSLILIMSIGVPIAVAFLLVNFAAAIIIFNVTRGPSFLLNSMFDSVSKFSLAPVPLFILMGALLFSTGVITNALDAISKWIGRVPGRLSLLSLGGGALFSNLSGSAVANTAVLGSMLVPEMRKQGYSKAMTYGPIMGAAGLAIVIPPSAIAIMLGSIGQIPVGPLLIAGMVPGLIMAGLYVVYVVFRCYRNPSLAPVYETQTYTLSDKIYSSIKYILPLIALIVIVLSIIFMGVATPTEASAVGALGALILAMMYRRLNIRNLTSALHSTLKTTGMVMLIIASAAAFSQLLAITGATRGLTSLVANSPWAPMAIILLMILIVFILGMFLEQIAIMMLVLPIFVPIVSILGFDLVWFGIVMLVTMEIGTFSPPFGMILFVMRSVTPKDVSMMDIYKSAFPFILIDAFVVFLLLIFPTLATWLPSLMYR